MTKKDMYIELLRITECNIEYYMSIEDIAGCHLLLRLCLKCIPDEDDLADAEKIDLLELVLCNLKLLSRVKEAF